MPHIWSGRRPLVLGMRFKVQKQCVASAFRYFQSPGECRENAKHTGYIYDPSGSRLAGTGR